MWWNYKSKKYQPPSIPTNNNNNYKNTIFKVDLKIDLINCILNIMYIYNFNIKYLFKNKKLFIKSFNKYNILKLYFKYPYTIIVSNIYIFNLINKNINIKSVFMINVLPISDNQSRLYITIKYKEGFINYFLNLLHSFIIKIFIYKLKYKLEQSYNNFEYKHLLFFNKNENNNNYLLKLYNCYKDYMPLNDFTIKHFMINKNFY